MFIPLFISSTIAAASPEQPITGAGGDEACASICGMSGVGPLSSSMRAPGDNLAVPAAAVQPAPPLLVGGEFALAGRDFADAPAAIGTETASPVDGALLAIDHKPAGGIERASVGHYSAGVFWRQARSIPWRFGGATAAITIGGFSNWNWGSSEFRFNSEGWFGKDTSSLGMDKLGHAYSTYLLTEFFTDGIRTAPGDRSGSYTGAILAMGLMTYIEVFDGFSTDHGFSFEDLAVDAAGALFSVVRRSVPGMREKLDFRLLYVPSENTWNALSCFPEPHCDRDGVAVRGPVTDYSHQRYLMALKLSGFVQFQDSPLRFLELHGGYYARGFTKEEEERGDPLRRRFFFGAGINLSELFFPGKRRGIAGAIKSGLEYLQVPYTAIHSN